MAVRRLRINEGILDHKYYNFYRDAPDSILARRYYALGCTDDEIITDLKEHNFSDYRIEGIIDRINALRDILDTKSLFTAYELANILKDRTPYLDDIDIEELLGDSPYSDDMIRYVQEYYFG